MVAAFPDRDDSFASLNQLALHIDYGVQAHASITDNEYYTTLHPSALHHSKWAVQADFLPMRNGSDLEPQGLAFCLRQLLAFYIAGKCNQYGQTVVGMSGKNGIFMPIDRARVLAVANVLSIRSRDAVSSVCAPVPPECIDDNGNFIANPTQLVTIPQDLLMR